MYEKHREHNPELSKLYKALVSVKQLYTRLGVNVPAIKRYFRGTKKAVPDNINHIVQDYINYVIHNGLDNPNGVEVSKLGTIRIFESKRLTSKPRWIPDDKGGFEEVVEHAFERHTKYHYQFIPNYNKIKHILNRLMDNPMLQNLKLSSAASYVKDFASILNLAPLKEEVTRVLYVKNYMHKLPANASKHNILGVEQLNDDGTVMDDNDSLPARFYENSLLAANSKRTRVRGNDARYEYGTYEVKGDYIHFDQEEVTVALSYTPLKVDELGYPVLPYDGSLAQAVENYIKFRYYTILYENDMIAYQKVAQVHSEYTWYVGQYTMKHSIPTYDEAVAWANEWQSLLDSRSNDRDASPFQEILNM